MDIEEKKINILGVFFRILRYNEFIYDINVLDKYINLRIRFQLLNSSSAINYHFHQVKMLKLI